jgi:hypothetical protein
VAAGGIGHPRPQRRAEEGDQRRNAGQQADLRAGKPEVLIIDNDEWKDGSKPCEQQDIEEEGAGEFDDRLLTKEI